MNRKTYSGTHAIRAIGALFGAFRLISFLAPKSEVKAPTIISTLKESMLILLGCLLVVPWQKIETKSLWVILFSLLACSASIQTITQIKFCFWAFAEGAPLQQKIFPILTAIETVILVSQISVIIKIKNSNQSTHSIADSAGSE